MKSIKDNIFVSSSCLYETMVFQQEQHQPDHGHHDAEVEEENAHEAAAMVLQHQT